MKLAGTEPALLGRDLAEIETSAPGDVIAYRRGDLVVLVNTRAHGVDLTLKGLSARGARDLLSNRIQQGDTMVLPAYGAMVLKTP
jgi:hypothetical protein